MEKSVQINFQYPEDKRPATQRFTELIDSTGGIDKIFRLFQFYAKFILPLIKNKDHELILKLGKILESFGALCGLTRKMLRIGRYFNGYKNIMARINKKSDDREFNDVIKSFSDISNFIFVILDHILLVNKLNVFKIESSVISKVDFYCNLSWGSECVLNLISDNMDYYKNSGIISKCKADLKKIDNSDSAEYKALVEKASKLNYEQFKKLINITRIILDLPVVLHLLTSDKVVSNTQAGFLGIVTSLLACYQKWIK